MFKCQPASVLSIIHGAPPPGSIYTRRSVLCCAVLCCAVPCRADPLEAMQEVTDAKPWGPACVYRRVDNMTHGEGP